MVYLFIEFNKYYFLFPRNEFLAVRNEDGGFYLCQAMQNIHRASRRIRIRWLTQHPNDEFTPDFYDHTGKYISLSLYTCIIKYHQTKKRGCCLNITINSGRSLFLLFSSSDIMVNVKHSLNI